VKKKILIVEDHADWRRLLCIGLGAIGYETVEAQDGEEALSLAVTEQPDVVLLDLGLPDFTGVTVITTLKRNPETSQIPIAVVSAWPAEIWKAKAMRAGAALYMMKPKSIVEIGKAIEELPMTPRDTALARPAQG
jgi:DNA-binding response OmpR family regulator